MRIFLLCQILLLPLVPTLSYLRGLLFIYSDMNDCHMSRNGTCIRHALLRHEIKHLNRHNQAMMNIFRSYWRIRGTLALKARIVFLDRKEHHDQHRNEQDDHPGSLKKLGEGDNERHQQRGACSQAVDHHTPLPVRTSQAPPVSHHASLRE